MMEHSSVRMVIYTQSVIAKGRRLILFAILASVQSVEQIMS